MKKIASLLVFVFTLQISAPSYAQNIPSARSKELADCYGKLFTKFSDVVSDDVGQKVEITAVKRLQFLHDSVSLLGYQRFNGLELGEIHSTIYKFAGPTIGFLGLAGLISNASDDQKFKLKLRSSVYITGMLVLTGVFISGLWISARGFNDKSGDLLLSNELPSSYASLTKTQSEHDFFTQATSNNPTSQEIGAGLFNYCQELLKTDFTPTLERLNNLTEVEIKQLNGWLNSSK